MYLIKGKAHTYQPYTDKDYEESKKVAQMEILDAKRARNPRFHRKVFALLQTGFQNQDRFDNFETYRKVMLIRGGFCEWVEGNEQVIPIPWSMSYDSMSQSTLEEVFEKFLDLIAKDLHTAPDKIKAELAGYF